MSSEKAYKKIMENLPELAVKAIKCSYCQKLIQDNEKNEMGFETKEWAICGKCFIDVCDKGMKEFGD